MLSQEQLLLALHYLNGGKYQDFRPKRVWEGEIKLGDLIEITNKKKRDGTWNTYKRVGVVTELVKTAIGCAVVLKLVNKEGKIVDGCRCGALESLIYSKTDIGRKKYDYDYNESFKICRISFSQSEKRIDRLYREFVEECHRAKAKAAEEARIEAERKAKEEEELRQRAIQAQKEEEERRSQTMTITVGMWEDLIRRVQDLEYSVDND